MQPQASELVTLIHREMGLCYSHIPGKNHGFYRQ